MAHAAHAHAPAHKTEEASLSGLIAEAERAFDWWNDRYYDNMLPRPLISIFDQTSNGHRLGHFRSNIWIEQRDGVRVRRDEVILYADLCLSQGPVQMMETLVHEFVHVWQQAQGKPGKNNHHNIAWHQEAQRIGLLTEEDPKGSSHPGPGFLADLELFKLRVDLIPWRDRRKRQKGKQKKWTCDCGYAVRVAKPDFDAHCNRCDEDFKLEES